MVGAVKQVATVLNEHKASLEEIIADAEYKTADLRKQRDTLTEGMRELQKQIDEINKQILLVEGSDSVVARKVVAQINEALTPPPRPPQHPMHPGRPPLPPHLAARMKSLGMET